MSSQPSSGHRRCDPAAMGLLARARPGGSSRAQVRAPLFSGAAARSSIRASLLSGSFPEAFFGSRGQAIRGGLSDLRQGWQGRGRKPAAGESPATSSVAWSRSPARPPLAVLSAEAGGSTVRLDQPPTHRAARRPPCAAACPNSARPDLTSGRALFPPLPIV